MKNFMLYYFYEKRENGRRFLKHSRRGFPVEEFPEVHTPEENTGDADCLPKFIILSETEVRGCL